MASAQKGQPSPATPGCPALEVELGRAGGVLLTSSPVLGLAAEAWTQGCVGIDSASFLVLNDLLALTRLAEDVAAGETSAGAG